ncbi:NADH:flavin oxidoreductase/NADH oxidase [Campylobacter sp. RM12920]|uniref:NADH:flavin oxidoreductase/NADH oxidase n=1 Tax=Campylobacter californiensis TaxID=1032243 RepID=A0ABD4JG65_9BACT|nr:NADH:flavin oxidoreductase/NADH oxidase [Campylobacter sp. RM12919]MBE2987887.1 NADH:flavin oxidoreductase/NADH oxidase [Campylobacter sp. RM12920]
MSKLFTPFKIGNSVIKNRIVMPPMCMYKVKDDNGFPRCFHRLHYAARSLGGAGLIIVEATAIEPRGRITHNDLGIWNDEQKEAHARLVKECVKYGAKMAIQLAHAGRKSECDDTPLAPSALKFSNEYQIPKVMSLDDIAQVKSNFINAAIRAQSAGYEIIEIHAAHGYLINQFLSKSVNKREDNYGGSFENRTRLLKEILTEMRAAVSIPIGVRLSADSWKSDDYDIDESVRLAKELESLGAAFIHVSSGGVHSNVDRAPKFVPLYQAGYAKAIKEVVKIPVIAVGLITTASEGEALLLGDVCDGVAYGRELLRNPNFAQTAMRDLGEKELIEKPYRRAF